MNQKLNLRLPFFYSLVSFFLIPNDNSKRTVISFLKKLTIFSNPILWVLGCFFFPPAAVVPATALILGVVGTYGSVGATPEEIRLKAVADLSATLNEADIISSLVSLWRSGFIEVTCDRPLLALASVGKPRAPEYSRMQAQTGELATSLRHEALQLSPIEREIIIRSSGEQEAATILNELSQDHPRDTVQAAYDRLVQLGFLLL